jgi:hypothetical protein
MPRTALSFFAFPYRTDLPTSPVDGQTIDYIADAANGVVWRLRYRAASASAYKWEFVGGAPLRTHVDTDETLVEGATYVDPTTPGPSLTLPLAGDYSYAFSAALYVSGQTTGVGYSAGLSLAGAQPASPDAASGYGATGQVASPGRAGQLLGQPAARVVKLQYNVGTAAGGTAHARWRELQITPVRVG